MAHRPIAAVNDTNLKYIFLSYQYHKLINFSFFTLIKSF